MHLDHYTIDQWLQEDLGHHDVVNDVPGTATARLVVTEPGVIAGIETAVQVLEHLNVEVKQRIESGSTVDADMTLLTAEAPTQTLLRGERIVTNLVAHASGIATHTSQAVEIATACDPAVTIAATRKTTPGLRGIEKRAVAAGGGDTHRLDCSQAVLIKENHIAELGLEGAIERARSQMSFVTTLEIEVESLDQLRRAMSHDIDVVLLDNFSPDAVSRAVDIVDGEIVTEASGEIDLDTLSQYAVTGVDVISMGSLTHSAPALDCSFRLE